MFERTVESLGEEYAELELHEQRCHELIGLLEDEHNELGISADMAIITSAVLGTLSDTIHRRVTELENLLEAERNQAMDRFRKRKIS